MKKVLTLCVVVQDGRILLGKKKRGFGMGKWNGFGGKVEAGESIEAAAKRELSEEAGIQALAIEKRGRLEFEFPGGESEALEIHVYLVASFDGQPSESDEMEPRWFDLETIPYQEMWADDQHWLPLFLQGKSIHGRFIFQGLETIIEHTLSEIELV